MITRFPGFPASAGRVTPLPEAFFSDLLPLIDDLAELKVTLFCFWALYQKEGRYRFLRRPDFAADAALMAGLEAANPLAAPDDTLDAALRRMCQRESLLRCEALAADGTAETLYFVNTALGRQAVELIATGAWQPGDQTDVLPPRPNIYQLYEDNIGPLTPMIADALKDAERDYPVHWLTDAVRVAVENNARSLRYIIAVLEGWRKEGRSRETPERSAQADTRDGRRYVSGKYADYIEH